MERGPSSLPSFQGFGFMRAKRTFSSLLLLAVAAGAWLVPGIPAGGAPRSDGDEPPAFEGGPIEIEAWGSRRGPVVRLAWRWNPAVDPGPGFAFHVRRKIYGGEMFDTVVVFPRDGRNVYRFRDESLDPRVSYRYKVMAARAFQREFRTPPLTFPAQRLQVTGPPVTVYDRNVDGGSGSLHDFPDGPVRFVRVANRNIVIMPNIETFRGIAIDPPGGFGPPPATGSLRPRLFTVFPRRPVFTSKHRLSFPVCGEDLDIGPVESLQNLEWLWSVWVDPEDSGRIFGLVHNEYHECPDFQDDHYNVITGVYSTDGGQSFQPIAQPPFHAVATPPFRFDPDADESVGFFAPTNIVPGRTPDGELDGFHYAFFRSHPYDPDGNGPEPPILPDGTCLMRTKSVDPTSPDFQWEAWAGKSESGADEWRPFVNPYVDTIHYPRRHEPKLVAPMELSGMHSSVYYSEVLEEYILVGMTPAWHPADNRTIQITYSVTTQGHLTGEWSPRQLLLDVPVFFTIPCTNELDPVGYPALYDPTSADPNFATLSSDRFWLFLTRFNWTRPDACQGESGGTRDRDMIAYPVQIRFP